MINLTKKNGFFTLYETVTALAVMAALAAITYPRFEMAIEKSRAAEAIQNIELLYKAQSAFFHENKAYSNNAGNLDVGIRASNYFDPPVFSTVDPIVSIPRTGGSYSITVTPAGRIGCIPAGTTCEHLGF